MSGVIKSGAGCIIHAEDGRGVWRFAGVLARRRLTITQNMAVVNHFTPPKTESGNRTIKLTNSAIKALKEQMALTRIGKQIKVDVHLREFGRIRKDDCTFVFSPRLSARNGKGG